MSGLLAILINDMVNPQQMPEEPMEKPKKGGRPRGIDNPLRLKAQAQGKKYFMGSACVKDPSHVSANGKTRRFSSSGRCEACNRALDAKWNAIKKAERKNAAVAKLIQEGKK